MKILIDMNLSPRWQKFLMEAGLQSAHWSELGAGNASDLNHGLRRGARLRRAHA
jgi:predicted nuclease of predicted toxin-antitoxin system